MHFRHVFFYEYKKGNNVAWLSKNISATSGEGSLSERTCRKWFTRFRKRNFNLSDESRPSRPSNCNSRSSNEKCMTKYFRPSRGFGDSKVNGRLKFKDDGNGKPLRCLGTAYIDRKALTD